MKLITLNQIVVQCMLSYLNLIEASQAAVSVPS